MEVDQGVIAGAVLGVSASEKVPGDAGASPLRWRAGQPSLVLQFLRSGPTVGSASATRRFAFDSRRPSVAAGIAPAP